MEDCLICGDPIDADNIGVKLGSKGITSLLKACKARKNESLYSLVNTRVAADAKILLHVICRKTFTDLRSVADDQPPPTKKTRSSIEPFIWDRDCFFCGKICDKKHDNDIKTVETISLKSHVLNVCNEYPEDDELAGIKHRVMNCSDLVAKDAIYHGQCMTKFYLKRETSVVSNMEICSSSSSRNSPRAVK